MANSSVELGPTDELALSWVQGDAATITLTMKDANGAAIDYTGSTFAATYRQEFSTDFTDYNFTVDDTSKASGVVVLTTPTTANMPSSGRWDFRATDGSGNKTTLARGPATVKDNVTA